LTVTCTQQGEREKQAREGGRKIASHGASKYRSRDRRRAYDSGATRLHEIALSRMHVIVTDDQAAQKDA
jgi:hypothetical protein